MLAGRGTLRRAKIAPEGSVGAPPTVRKDVRLTKRPRRLLRTDFRAFWRCRVQLPTQRASAFYLGKTDVLRTSDVFRVEQSSHEKTSQKLPFRARGASGEQVRAPKRPGRAAKRDKGARSSAIFLKWVRTGQLEREKGELLGGCRRTKFSDFFLKWVRTSQSEREKCVCWAKYQR